MKARIPEQLAIVGFCLWNTNIAVAQDLEPRRYNNLPVGQNFLALAYSYSEGDVNVSPSIPLEDAELRVDGPALAYLRSFEIAGNSAMIDLSLPYVCASGSATFSGERVSAHRCGYGDLSLRLGYNFFGAPAVNRRSFASLQSKTVAGVSIQIGAPTGDYDETKLINTGTNRWFIKPEIGLSIPWRKWSFEFAAGVRFFSDNDEFLEVSTLEQDPLYNVQAHVIYNLTRRQWVSLNSNYFFGGETYVDGMQSANQQANSRLGFTWSMALNPSNLVKVLVHTGVVTRVGNDSDTVTIAWTYIWGRTE